MFEKLIELLEKHANYGPAMRKAVGEKRPLILNYHTHGGPTFCVSIALNKPNPLAFLGQAAPLEEVAHIKGVGRAAEDCGPMMTDLGTELQAHYKLDALPSIYFNGRPFDAAQGRPFGGETRT